MKERTPLSQAGEELSSWSGINAETTAFSDILVGDEFDEDAIGVWLNESHIERISPPAQEPEPK